MRDFRWMSNGGILVDGSGDIACTDGTSMESIRDIVQSRLKAALNGWQLYPIGADLQRLAGETVSDEIEVTLKRQVQQALMDGFLLRGSFQVETLAIGTTIQVVVFLNLKVIAQATVTNIPGNPIVSVTV